MARKSKEGREPVWSGLVREGLWKGPERSCGDKGDKVNRGKAEEQPSKVSRKFELKPKASTLAGVPTSWSG